MYSAPHPTGLVVSLMLRWVLFCLTSQATGKVLEVLYHPIPLERTFVPWAHGEPSLHPLGFSLRLVPWPPQEHLRSKLLWVLPSLRGVASFSWFSQLLRPGVHLSSMLLPKNPLPFSSLRNKISLLNSQLLPFSFQGTHLSPYPLPSRDTSIALAFWNTNQQVMLDLGNTSPSWGQWMQWLDYHLHWEQQSSLWMKHKLIYVVDCVIVHNDLLSLSTKRLDTPPTAMWLAMLPCEKYVFPAPSDVRLSFGQWEVSRHDMMMSEHCFH